MKDIFIPFQMKMNPRATFQAELRSIALGGTEALPITSPRPGCRGHRCATKVSYGGRDRESNQGRRPSGAKRFMKTWCRVLRLRGHFWTRDRPEAGAPERKGRKSPDSHPKRHGTYGNHFGVDAQVFSISTSYISEHAAGRERGQEEAHPGPGRVTSAAEMGSNGVVHPVDVLRFQVSCVTVASGEWGQR